MTRAEFLAMWFVHDDAGWRMKGHAVQPFYRWLASWAMAFRKPSDLGYADDGFILPELRIHEHIVEGATIDGALFPELGMKGLTGRLAARRGSLALRVDVAADLIDGHPWIVWCGLNVESRALAGRLRHAVEISGADSYAEKRAAVESFLRGETRVLVSKPKILGFGLNFQHCHQMAFVGLSDSYETYYQCIRRCWRFGQRQPVDVFVVVSEAETGVVQNVRRKEAAADALSRELLAEMHTFEREELCA